MNIKFSTALRNDYGSISALAHETGEPIYITQNSEGDIVVTSMDAFEERGKSWSNGGGVCSFVRGATYPKLNWGGVLPIGHLKNLQSYDRSTIGGLVISGQKEMKHYSESIKEQIRYVYKVGTSIYSFFVSVHGTFKQHFFGGLAMR